MHGGSGCGYCAKLLGSNTVLAEMVLAEKVLAERVLAERVLAEKQWPPSMSLARS